VSVRGEKVGRPLLRSDTREEPAAVSTDFPLETTLETIEEPFEATEATSESTVVTTGGTSSVSEW
jgi:hypothetical protein